MAAAYLGARAMDHRAGSMTKAQEPFRVVLNLHVPGKGYSLSVVTDHAEMQVYVSEKGRVIKAYEPRVLNAREGLGA